MTDLANQGKGSIWAIYGTNDFNIIRLIKQRCIAHGIDFFEPGDMKRQLLLEAMKLNDMVKQNKRTP